MQGKLGYLQSWYIQSTGGKTSVQLHQRYTVDSYINNCYVCTNSYKLTLLKYARKARTDLIWP